MNNSEFERNKKFERNKMPEVKMILQRHAGTIIRFEAASSEQDTQQATDLVVYVKTGAIGVRVRQFKSTGKKYRDWTIRCKSCSGYATEIDKLRAGWGDFYFYGWDNKNGHIDEYMLLDLAKVRDAGLLYVERKVIPNGDGTSFISIDALELYEKGCLLIHTLPEVPGQYKIANRTNVIFHIQQALHELGVN